MRFAYIDSNGNEVPIPSVDALALRIELGAITDDTQLYDAQADLWAPANSHEIYHTLSRDLGGEGFVPAPAAPPRSTPVVPERPAEPRQEITDLAPEPPAPAPEPAPSAEAGDSFVLEGPAEADSGQTLAADAPVEPEPAPDAAADDLGVEALELAPMDVSDPVASEGPPDLTAPPDSSPASHAEDAGEEGPTFDFSGGLEVEGAESASESAGAAPMDFTSAIPDAEEPIPDFSGGMELETAAEFDRGFDTGSTGPLELETPMSEFTPDAPPGWMEAGPDSGGEDVMDLSSVGARTEESATDVTGPTEKRVPKNKPSPPKFKKQRNLAGPIIGVVLVSALGIGGYAAWPVISGLLEGEPEDAGTVIPPIPSALEPQMMSVANATVVAIYESVRTDWAADGPIATPGPDWLSGRYLATASEYPEAETFWEGMSDLMVAAAGIDLTTFDAAYGEELQRQAVSEADGALMRARADSGFVAAATARAATHQQLEDLIDAALRLHSFLVSNEASIEHVPASSATADPILEAVPATPELRSSMEGLIGNVTNALSDLDYRSQVTADGLWQSFVTRVHESAVQ